MIDTTAIIVEDWVEHLRSEASYSQTRIEVLEEALREIYALRGEDKAISKIFNEVMK